MSTLVWHVVPFPHYTFNRKIIDSTDRTPFNKEIDKSIYL